jgi:hypothetical protein
MTYPPGNPGYPPGQQPTTQFSQPTQQFGKIEQSPAGPSKLPIYLLAAVAFLGLAVYLVSFGPMFTISATDFPQLGSASGTSLGLGLAVAASVLAALFAGVSLLPKQTVYTAVVAAVSVLAFLLVVSEVINKPEGVSIDWALYVVIVFTLLQALAAVGALLMDAGIITPPAPRPKYEQQQYGQYGAPGQYYGQQHGLPQGGAPQQQRPGYPSQYGGYPGGPASGGFTQAGSHGGPPTPPTGFPTYGQPQPSSSSAPTSQVPAQPQASNSSQQSGNAPS